MPSISFRLVPLATSISALIYRACRFVSRLRMLHSHPIARRGRKWQITQTLRFIIARQVAHSSIANNHDALMDVMPFALPQVSIFT